MAYAEEDAFRQTPGRHRDLRPGRGRGEKSGGETLSGERVFGLHDTLGFLIDLTWRGGRAGLNVDEVELRRLMTEQRERAKADAKAEKGQHRDASAYRDVADTLGRPVEFTGYTDVVSEASVRGIVALGGVVPSAREGDEIELVLDRTPFYAEGGGQLADQGVIELDSGARLQIRDVQSPITGLIVHQAKVILRRGHPRIPCAGPRGHRPTVVDLTVAHRDAHGAQGVPRGAGGDRDPGGIGERPGPLPVRLLRDGSGPRVGHGTNVEARVNDLVLADLAVHAEVMTQARPSGRARWRCSVRSTATRCASSPWATGRASCAVAPMRVAPASSGWSS